jgi:hypothetical protein
MGSDYTGGGVKGLGPVKSLELVQALGPDALQTLISWREEAAAAGSAARPSATSSAPAAVRPPATSQGSHSTAQPAPARAPSPFADWSLEDLQAQADIVRAGAGAALTATLTNERGGAGAQYGLRTDVSRRQLIADLVELSERLPGGSAPASAAGSAVPAAKAAVLHESAPKKAPAAPKKTADLIAKARALFVERYAGDDEVSGRRRGRARVIFVVVAGVAAAACA